MNVDELIIDAFAGPGGWDEGARIAGYTGRILGIEKDMAACRTGLAAGHWRVCADVAAFPLAHLAGKVTGVIESPPCPTFSTAGEGAGKVDLPNVLRLIADYAAGREPDAYEWVDERSALSAQPMRYAVALRPRWIALEQVPPVLPIWQYIADRLRALSYRVWTGILSAEEYGVPQTRKRAILMASLDGSVGPPAPTHQEYVSGRPPQLDDDLFGSPLPPPVSMAAALGWGEAAAQVEIRGAGMAERHGDRPDRPLAAPSKTVTSGSRGGPALGWVMRSNYGTGGNAQDRGERTADEPAPTVTSKIDRNVVVWTGVNSRQAGGTTKIFERTVDAPSPTLTGNVNRWQARPATTVCGDARIAPPGHRDREGGERQFGEDTVRVSVQEAGILQSFPPDYPWQGTKTQQYLQVGNAIPPLLAAAILRPLLGVSDEGVVAA